MKVYLVLGFKLTTFQTWAAYFSRIIKARIKKQPNFSKSRNYLKSYIFTKKAQIVTNFWVSTFVRKFHTRRGPLKNCQIWSHCLRPIHITVFDLCICGRLLRFHKDTFHNPQSTAENADCVASSVNHPLWIGIEVVTFSPVRNRGRTTSTRDSWWWAGRWPQPSPCTALRSASAPPSYPASASCPPFWGRRLHRLDECILWNKRGCVLRTPFWYWFW